MKHLTWSSRNNAIWEMASKLQENSIQVDVYLHAEVKEDYNLSDHNKKTSSYSAKKKKSLKESISFPAHKLILAAASPFLQKVLNEHYIEHRDACVNISIPNVVPEAIHCILDFIYCGNANISSGIKKSVLEVANLLEIKDFTYYIQSNAKFKSSSGQKNTTLHENLLEPQIVAADTHRLRGRRKRKQFRDTSVDVLQVEEEGAAEQDTEEVDLRVSRRRRKVKSKYSAEIYEINLPKSRKWKRRKLQGSLNNEKETSDARTQDFEVSQEPQKEAIPSSTKTTPHSVEKYSVDELPENGLIKGSLPSPSPTIYPSFTDRENKISTLQFPLTLTSVSSSSSSVVIPEMFVPNQSYHTESTIKSKVIVQDCEALNKKPLQRPAVTSGSPPLLLEVKELPLISTSSSLTNFPLKQLTSFTHDHKIAEPLSENKNEVEEQDGLFKLQVLLKGCEDFPSDVCVVPQSSQESRRNSSAENYQPGETSDDISTWISEELNTCIIPASSVCDKDSSQCEILTEDYKKQQEEHNTTDLNTLDSNVDKNQKEIECVHCGKKFPDHRSCQSHIRGVHGEAKQMCRYCGKMFRRRCDLYMHERRHKRASLPCKYCGKIFKVAKDLHAHILTHVGGKRFHCDYCQKELTSYRNLKNHIASIHQKQRPFACQECNKTYLKAYSLQVHMRSVHTGERPFKCTVCDKTFCDPDVLKNHQVIHTGEKKYSCKVCGRPFSQYSNMITHQRIHTNHRPFLCFICQEDFKTKEGLLKHKWIHTGRKPLRCHHCNQEFRIKGRYERHMLKLHNEVINISDPIFELMDQMEEENTSSSYCNIKVVGKTGEEEQVQDGSHDQMLDNRFSEGVADDLSPVIHLVSNIAEQEIGSGEPGHVELSYPLLTSTTELEEGSSITLCNIASPISCSGPVDVESLLNSENTASSETLMESGREVKELFYFSNMSGATDEISEEINSESTIKIWITNKNIT